MSIDYKLYNVKSNIFQNNIPRAAKADEIWIRFAGVVGLIYYQVENYNKDVWVRFNKEDLNGIFLEELLAFYNVSPGIITPSANVETSPSGSLLLAVATLPARADIKSFLTNDEFKYTSIVTNLNNSYSLLVTGDNVFYQGKYQGFITGLRNVYSTDENLQSFLDSIRNSNGQLDPNRQVSSNRPVNLLSNEQFSNVVGSSRPINTSTNDDKFIGYFVHYHVYK